MKSLIIFLFITLSCGRENLSMKKSYIEAANSDSDVMNVIKSQKPLCRFNSTFNCIKPINQPGSGVSAVELKVNGVESFNIITYDQYGRPSKMNDDFEIEIKATKNPASIDANVVRRTIKIEQQL